MSDNSTVFPRLRQIETYPFEERGERYFYIRDPMEIAESPLVLTGFEYYVLTLLDGQNSAEDILGICRLQLQANAEQSQRIWQLLELLDEQGYLDTPRFQARLEHVFSSYHQSPIRPASLAGKSYPAEAEALTAELEGFYAHPEGAGKQLQNGSNGHPSSQRRLKAIMAPHIDLRAGGPCYTHAYRDFARLASGVDLFIILGVAHYGGNDFFTATYKDFETPFGSVETDRAFLEAWAKEAGADLAREEIAHRTEHSIEFQLPFLQHALDRPFRILPVLTGAMEPYFYDGKTPADHPEIAAQIDSLQRTIDKSGQRVMFILSVDLAHMGPRFGDASPIDDAAAAAIAAADQRMFEAISNLDLNAFSDLMQGDLFGRRVDACAAVYVLLSIMKSGGGELVGYGQNRQPDSGSIVTYGSMQFWA